MTITWATITYKGWGKMKVVLEENRFSIVFKPLHLDKEVTLSIDKPGPDYKEIFFKTATSKMRILKKKSGEIYIEHLKVNGVMELLPFQGVHAGDNNFYNIGWENDEEIVYLRIDIYTGETASLKRNK